MSSFVKNLVRPAKIANVDISAEALLIHPEILFHKDFVMHNDKVLKNKGLEEAHVHIDMTRELSDATVSALMKAYMKVPTRLRWTDEEGLQYDVDVVLIAYGPLPKRKSSREDRYHFVATKVRAWKKDPSRKRKRR